MCLHIPVKGVIKMADKAKEASTETEAATETVDRVLFDTMPITFKSVKDKSKFSGLEAVLTRYRNLDDSKLDKNFRRVTVAYEDGDEVYESSDKKEAVVFDMAMAGEFEGEFVEVFGEGISPDFDVNYTVKKGDPVKAESNQPSAAQMAFETNNEAVGVIVREALEALKGTDLADDAKRAATISAGNKFIEAKAKLGVDDADVSLKAWGIWMDKNADIMKGVGKNFVNELVSVASLPETLVSAMPRNKNVAKAMIAWYSAGVKDIAQGAVENIAAQMPEGVVFEITKSEVSGKLTSSFGEGDDEVMYENALVAFLRKRETDVGANLSTDKEKEARVEQQAIATYCIALRDDATPKTGAAKLSKLVEGAYTLTTSDDIAKKSAEADERAVSSANKAMDGKTIDEVASFIATFVMDGQYADEGTELLKKAATQFKVLVKAAKDAAKKEADELAKEEVKKAA